MKVNPAVSEHVQQSFKPFSITVTVEHQDEYKLLSKFLCANLTLPHFMSNKGFIDTRERDTLTNIMSMMNNAIVSANKKVNG